MQFNNDTIIEKIVKKKITSKDKFCRILFVILAILAILLVNILPLFFGITYLFLLTGALSFGIGFLCYFSVTGIEKEYEYSLVNDELNIDIIRGKKRRSHLFAGSVRDFEMVAKKNDERHPISEFDKGDALHGNCVSGEDPDNEWYISTKMGSVKVLLLIEPDERMLNVFFRYNPRNTMYRPTSRPNAGKSKTGE